jgi:hypothetical protein
MKKIEGYACEICGQIWTNEKQAVDCENGHVNFKELKITWAKYNDYETISDVDNRKKLQEYIPQIIKVEHRDKEHANQFGCKSFISYYELKRYEYTYDEDDKHQS